MKKIGQAQSGVLKRYETLKNTVMNCSFDTVIEYQKLNFELKQITLAYDFNNDACLKKHLPLSCSAHETNKFRDIRRPQLASQ